MADTLFLLQAGFTDEQVGPGTFYCPGCAAVKGLLAYFPQLLDVLDVQDVGFARPRPQVAALLGSEHPGCPLLVLDHATAVPEGTPVSRADTGYRYILGSAAIGAYFSAAYGTAAPHP